MDLHNGVPLNRIPPKMAVGAYQTYSIAVPRATHWRPASCAEVNCPDHLNGWQTVVNEATDLGQRQAHYIRHDRSRKATESRTEAGLTVFTFEAGQTCFREHQIQARPEIYVERDGDFRGNPTGRRRIHVRSDDWVDSFANHQDKIADIIRQG